MIQSPSEFAKSKIAISFEHVTVVGGGRIGTFLANLTEASVVTRQHGELQSTGPILVCVRNNDLEGVILRTPIERRQDLIFLQNGMIDSLLDSLGMQDSTRGILYFAIESKGGDVVDGGGSVFCGAYAPWLVSVLQEAKIGAKVVTPEEFQKEMGRKLIWNSVFGLLGQVYQKDVGQILDQHRSEFQILLSELQSVFESTKKMSLGDDLEQALTAYALKVSHYHSRASEWEWRNGWFLTRMPTPLHSQLSLKIGKVF
ncbi:MAG: hypothetical protein WCI18_01795 [Pseudomonadota bacterium]